MALALPDLVALALLIVVYGLVTAGVGLVNFLNWFLGETVGRIPLLGNLVEATVGRGLQALSNYLGSVVVTYEGYIGWCFHNLAAEVDWVGRELAGATLFDVALAERLTHLAVRTITHEITHVVDAGATTVVNETVAGVHTVTRVADQALTASVGALEGRLGILEGDINGVLEPTIEQLRDRAKAIEDAYQRVWRLVKGHEEALAIGAVTAATAVAIDELGGSWIRCNGVGSLGRALCGLGPELIDGLLAASLLAMSPTDFCEIVTAAVGLVDEAAPALDFIVGAVDDLLACQGVDRPDALPYRIPQLPPHQAPAVLPLAA